MLKKFVLSLVVVSALTMGACGKKDDNATNGTPGTTPGLNGGNGVLPGGGADSKILGSCSADQICVQASAPGQTPADRVQAGTDQLKKNCEAKNARFSANGCPTANAAGACRSADGAAQIVTVFYNGGGAPVPVEQIKTYCTASHGEFFQP